MFILLLLSCESSKEARERAAVSSVDMSVGLIASEGLFREGAELALSEINKDLPQGKTLKLVEKDDEGDINKGILNATELASDPNTLAVLGHANSYISIPASSIYEFHGVLMLNPYSTAKELTSNGYDYTFRTLPNDETLASELVDYFIHKDLKSVHICYISNEYGRSFANAFEDKAESEGLDIVDRISYDVGDKREFNRIVKRWENYEYDSILFIGSMPEGENFYEVLHERGIKQYVVSSETMRSSKLLSNKKIDHNKSFLTIFSTGEDNQAVKSFVTKFKDRFKEDPDMYAALAYDAMTVLGEAIMEARSFSPKEIIRALKSMEPYLGVTNSFSFDKKGELISKKQVAIEKIDGDKFKFEGLF